MARPFDVKEIEKKWQDRWLEDGTYEVDNDDLRERYYALMFDRKDGSRVRLDRRLHDEAALAEQGFPWSLDQPYALALTFEGGTVRASIDGQPLFEVRDNALAGGAVALLVDTGSVATQEVRVTGLG